MSSNPLVLAYFIFVSAINLSLALAVYARNRENLVNRLFAVSVLCVVLWIICIFVGTDGQLIWKRAVFAFASLIPASFLLFARAFPSDQTVPRDPLVRLFVILGLVFFTISFTPAIVASLIHERPSPRISYGPLYPAFAAYFLLCFSTSFYFLWRKYRVVRGVEKLRIRYLFLGTFLAVAGAATTNLLIPLVLRTSTLRLFGPAFTVFAFTFVAHAILRYRLMDIRIVIRKGVVYFLSFLVSASLLAAASLVAYSYLHEQISVDLFILILTVGTTIALSFRPVATFFQRMLDRYAHRASYDEHETLQEAIRQLSSFLRRDALISYIGKLVADTVHAETTNLYFVEGGRFKCVLSKSATNDQPASSIEIPTHGAFLRRLRSTAQPLVREELRATAPDSEGYAISEEMGRLQWDLLLPISQERAVAGLLALGPKLSGDPYFHAEIQLLMTFMNQLSIVLTNARLYEEVKTVKDHIEGILGNMESGVVAADSAGVVTTINPAAEALLELNGETLVIGRPVEMLPAPFASYLREALDDGRVTFQTEAEVRQPNGSVLSMVMNTSLLRGSRGNILGAILVFTDHSKLKELEKEKRRTERLTAFQSMASGIAHEIKNPLVAIKTFAELLPERFTDDDFRNEFSKLVIREIERIDDLVSRLRGLGTPAVPVLKPIDIRAPIDETLALLRGQLQQARISVSIQHDSVLPQVMGDTAQLKQLFLNVLVNAIEAMEGGGTLSVTSKAKGTLAVRTISVEITDQGSGIPGELIGKIFDPFVTTKARGSGLGLSISRGIADAHHATITARNNRDVGTTVSIEFPALTLTALETVG